MVEILISIAQAVPGGPPEDGQLENPGYFVCHWFSAMESGLLQHSFDMSEWVKWIIGKAHG